jgi:hypothetical protein
MDFLAPIGSGVVYLLLVAFGLAFVFAVLRSVGLSITMIFFGVAKAGYRMRLFSNDPSTCGVPFRKSDFLIAIALSLGIDRYFLTPLGSVQRAVFLMPIFFSILLLACKARLIVLNRLEKSTGERRSNLQRNHGSIE